jgi:hypothetical protein
VIRTLDDAIESEILRLLSQRAADASICPSDVARSMEADEAAWRALLPRVRDAARRLAIDGRLRITRGEDVLDPSAPMRGAIRLRRGGRFGDAA